MPTVICIHSFYLNHTNKKLIQIQLRFTIDYISQRPETLLPHSGQTSGLSSSIHFSVPSFANTEIGPQNNFLPMVMGNFQYTDKELIALMASSVSFLFCAVPDLTRRNA